MASYSSKNYVGNRYWMQGICIPKSCANDETLQKAPHPVTHPLRDNFFPEDFLYHSGDGTVCELNPFVQCEPDTTWDERCSFSGSECWQGFGWFVTLFALTFLSTVFFVFKTGFRPLDAAKPENSSPSMLSQIVGYFSVQKTWKDLVNFKRNPKQLDSLNAMRVLAIIWVIVLHIQNLVADPVWNGTWM